MKRLIPLTVAAFGLLMAARPLCASTFTVLNTNDSGAGSLRAAITFANANPGPDEINFTVTGTITLTSAALPDITESVDILGPGAGDLTVNGNNSFRVFNIDSPSHDQTVTISDLAVTGGRADLGGGLRVGGGETATLSDTVVFDNIATAAGGGILNDGNLTITNATISGNRAIEVGLGSGSGGGIFNGAGRLTLIDSTVDGNGAFGDNGLGGGICNTSGTQIDLINSTISGNTANQDGGGIFNASGTSADLFNVTLAENIADNDDNGTGEGGGFANGGRLFSVNSIIAENHKGTNTQASDCSGDLLSAGHNLVGNSLGCTVTGSQSGDIKDQPSGLDPSLRNNGGSTRTHALLNGSLAIDAGSPEAPGSSKTACEPAAQNGATRPQGTACDIGAFELPAVADDGPGDIGTTGGATGADATGGGATGEDNAGAIGGAGSGGTNVADTPASGGCSLIRY